MAGWKAEEWRSDDEGAQAAFKKVRKAEERVAMKITLDKAEELFGNLRLGPAEQTAVAAAKDSRKSLRHVKVGDGGKIKSSLRRTNRKGLPEGTEGPTEDGQETTHPRQGPNGGVLQAPKVRF